MSLQLESSELSYEVPVLRPVRNPETGLDEITVPATANTPEYTIQIIPVAPSNTGNQEPVPVLPNHTGSDIEVVEGPMVITTPAADSDGWQDFIYWRPDAKGTGVEPVYVMTVSPRNMPGTVTGKGVPADENWLSKAGEGTGVPIPSQVADKLRGRTYSSFSSFRRAVWREVGRIDVLTKKFEDLNKELVKKSRSPVVDEIDSKGGRIYFEIHHIKSIENSGAVYDIDNLGITTPKNHVNIHK
nr:S-type pyocin domain-containing protein [Mixta theicola]